MNDDYNLQLQQVYTALLLDPNNTELLKLKEDLEEIIKLSHNLKASPTNEINENEQKPSPAASSIEKLLANLENSLNKKEWKVGDKCLAKWSENNQYYEAIIDKILPNDQYVNVTFLPYQNRSIVRIDNIKKIKQNQNLFLNHKKYSKHRKEHAVKKNLKRQQRLRELEQECEIGKNKWLMFNTKILKRDFSRNKSIFRSPDNENGRIGFGTCGISGKPMTTWVIPGKQKI